MMHPIQEKILKLSEKHNLAKLSLREIAEHIGMPEASPQKIKHHLLQLQKKGFLTIDRVRGMMSRTSLAPGWTKGILNKASRLFSIPIIGMANCGPATIFAEQNLQGFLRISKKLMERSKPSGLYTIKANGSSMNRAEIDGKYIEDGDYVIVDRTDKNPRNGDIVLVIIDNMATIKRVIDDRQNGQIVLKADSSFDYEPIYLHKDDDFTISGKIIQVIKNPRIE